MGELANCPRCGDLFVKSAISVCQKCYQEEEEKFEKVYAFIRQKKNRMATVDEVCLETDVEAALIMKWVQQKRLHPASFPNLRYECERCGEPIYEGKLCKSCANELKEGFLEEQPKTLAEKEAESKKNRAYINVDNINHRKY